MAGQAAAAWILRPVLGSDGDGSCTSCLMEVLCSDPGENLAKAGGDGAVIYLARSCLPVIRRRSSTFAVGKSSTTAVVRVRETMSSSSFKEHTDTLSLEVSDYLQVKDMGVGEFVSSRVFPVGGYEWEMRFYPGGKDWHCAGNASAYVFCRSQVKDVSTRFTLSMLHTKGQVQVASFDPRKRVFSPKATRYDEWGHPKFVERAKLESLSQLGDGCFTILCVVTVVMDEPPPLELHSHLERMLEDGRGADVTFSVANQEFRAHSFLLAARSPVFAAQLFDLMEGVRRVEIVDVEPAIFKMMLHYIYTESLPPYDDQGGNNIRVMQHLLVAANRYGLERLKLVCEEELCKRIDSETITTMSALADQHRCKRLKVACTEFKSSTK
ncbi:BTB/POZ and MATH domain-containing protein 2-like [Triticum urartu]|uniref:BTB/POZ and MATH domain-containing protein 2-like n=1 Tax=Triticum urartu TaxID=4572 RepID=UPI002043DF8F|nr:BTB/POZ and MATH domain-containing protein 2-like [Triticum urartu]